MCLFFIPGDGTQLYTTPEILALSLGSDIATASKHGRFAEIARAPQEKAKRAVSTR
jgi:carboxypeptidase D